MQQNLGFATSATADVRGFDTDVALTSATAKRMKRLGYDFCLRYLPIDCASHPSDYIQREETLAILDAGLALMPVQHVRFPGWHPTAALGAADGHVARRFAYEAGIPAHVNVWLDVEGVHETTVPQRVIDYCNAWYAIVSAWGYIPGIYVGAAALLDGESLYRDLRMQHYWKSASDVPTPVSRGYQMVQSIVTSRPCGIDIDEDVTKADEFGDSVQWLVK